MHLRKGYVFTLNANVFFFIIKASNYDCSKMN